MKIFEDSWITAEHKFPYKWTLKDAVFTKDKGNVFSCFACGGGSTMGYKLAGFDVLGCNEIDKKMIECYKINHNPKYAYNEDIRTLKLRNDLPDELYQLDILDGSPPCSSFSMAGNREKDWGKSKVFSEGQSKQVLDTLFFDFIELTEKLKPKIVIAENVKGIILGNAYHYYYKKIHNRFNEAGYNVNAYLLNAKYMGVPQSRERVFIIGIRKDIESSIPDIDMKFYEREILLKEFCVVKDKKITQNYSRSRFGDVLLNVNQVSSTIATDINRYWINENTLINDETIKLIGSYPLDYNFLNNNCQYLIGMSVPPVMMAQIATRIYEKYLKN